MPGAEERDANKVQREQDRELRRAERKTENERRKAAGQPPLPEDPEQPQPDQTLP